MLGNFFLSHLLGNDLAPSICMNHADQRMKFCLLCLRLAWGCTYAPHSLYFLTQGGHLPARDSGVAATPQCHCSTSATSTFFVMCRFCTSLGDWCSIFLLPSFLCWHPLNLKDFAFIFWEYSQTVTFRAQEEAQVVGTRVSSYGDHPSSKKINAIRLHQDEPEKGHWGFSTSGLHSNSLFKNCVLTDGVTNFTLTNFSWACSVLKELCF